MTQDVPQSDPREAKLPAWARELIERERRARENAQRLAERAALATKPSESTALLDRFDDVPIGLGVDPRIAFRVPFPGFRPEMSFIEIRQLNDRPGLYVSAVDEIVTRNRAINAIEIVPWPKA